VDEVVGTGAIDAEVAALAQRLTAGATSSVRAIKRLVRAQEIGALEQVLSTEGAAQVQALQGPEFRRRLEAFAARLATRAEGV
jgi:enoyl-CoA hydratase/carnithine racemase